MLPRRSIALWRGGGGTIWSVAANKFEVAPMQPDVVQSDLGAVVPRRHAAGHLMALYQQADASAAAALVDLLSPQLYRFFASQMGSTNEAEDML